MLSPKLRRVSSPGSKDGDVLVFWCPGCDGAHAVNVEKLNAWGAKWAWNGDAEKPTFTPSLLVSASSPEHRCHSHIRDGMIQFLDDCFHKLKGQTVEIPNWPLSLV